MALLPRMLLVLAVAVVLVVDMRGVNAQYQLAEGEEDVIQWPPSNTLRRESRRIKTPHPDSIPAGPATSRVYDMRWSSVDHTILLNDTLEFFSVVASDKFQNQYWERFPVLFRGAHGVTGLLSMDDDILSGEYVSGGDKRKAPFRNVNLLPGNFYRMQAAADSFKVPKGTPVPGSLLREALHANHTLQFLSSQNWWPTVAALCYNLSIASNLPTNANLYVTAGGVETSLTPHGDYTCNFMVQIHGRKRWRLWKHPDFWLPVDGRFIYGRDESEQLTVDEMGPPMMDVILEPGDILYVPRGCFHATQTLDFDGSPLEGISAHLTTQAAVMFDDGAPFSWNYFMASKSMKLDKQWAAALQTLTAEDARAREAIPAPLRQHGTVPPQTRELVREFLHEVVDFMVDRQDLLESTAKEFKAQVDKFRDHLEKLSGSALQQPLKIASNASSQSSSSSSNSAREEESTQASSSSSAEPSAKKPTDTSAPCFTNSEPGLPMLASMPVTVRPETHGSEVKQDGNEVKCYFERKPGLAAVIAQADRFQVATAIIVTVFKRPHLFEQTLTNLTKQTSADIDVYIWNNHADNSCVFERKLHSWIKAQKGNLGAVRSIWIHHSPVNVYQGMHILAGDLNEMYPNFVFVDDDCDVGPGVVAQLTSELEQFPQSLMCSWALVFLSPSNYWNRNMPGVHQTAEYCGGALFAAPAELFEDIEQVLSFAPDKFRIIWDLWLNAYAVTKKGFSLRRSGIPQHVSLSADDDSDPALSETPGMRELKTEFYQYLQNDHKYPPRIVEQKKKARQRSAPNQPKSEADFDARKAAARTMASTDIFEAVNLFDKLTTDYPLISMGWNDFGVTLLRAAGHRDMPERERLLRRAQHAFKTALETPERRDADLVKVNLNLVLDELKLMGIDAQAEAYEPKYEAPKPRQTQSKFKIPKEEL